MYSWLSVPPPPDWRTNPYSLLWYAAVAKRDWGAAWYPNTWVGIEEQMKRLQVLAKQHSFKVVFVAFPVVFQVDAEYVVNAPQQRLRGLAGKYHFHFLDLLPVLRSNNGGRRLIGDWCHLTVDGNDLVGKALASFLSEHVLIVK